MTIPRLLGQVQQWSETAEIETSQKPTLTKTT